MLSVNAVAIALVGAIVAQSLHELCHGIVALLAGGRWEWISFFAVSVSRTSDLGLGQNLMVAGSPALVDIALGAVAVALFELRWARRHPAFRLFFLYIAAFSLFTGFGHLLADPILYHAGNNLAEWQQVIALLGGDWMVRAAISLIGAAGLLRSFSWISQAVLSFVEPISELSDRPAYAFAFLAVPYFGVNLVFSLLTLRASSPAMALADPWLESAGFFICFLAVAFGMKRTPSSSNPTPIPGQILVSWGIAAILATTVVTFIFLPRITLG